MSLFHNPNISPHSLSNFFQGAQGGPKQADHKGLQPVSLIVTHTNPHFIWVGRITLGISCLLQLKPPYIYLLSIGFSSYERHPFISLNKQILFLDLAQISILF